MLKPWIVAGLGRFDGRVLRAAQEDERVDVDGARDSAHPEFPGRLDAGAVEHRQPFQAIDRRVLLPAPGAGNCAAAPALGAGALSGKLSDIGINDQFMKDLGATLGTTTAALFVLVRKSTPDKVLEALSPFAGKGRVLQTSLTKDKDEELRAFMEGKSAA